MLPTRENTDLGALITLTAQAAGTVTSPIQENLECKGVMVVIDLTTRNGTPTCTVSIEALDQASGKFIALLTSTALAAAATTTLTLYPSMAVSANVSASAPLPLTWRVKAVVAGSTSYTGTISALTIK